MMKFIFIILFMNFMLMWNKVVVFYYNLCYFISFMILFMYMNKDLVWGNISLVFGMEYYSIFLIALSFWIISLMMMCLSDSGDDMKMFIFINLLLVLIMFFSLMNLILFYLLYEISLIPTFFLIIYWGSNLERLSASYYLMMYMLIISFPLLIYVVDMYYYSLTFKFSLMSLFMVDYFFSFIGYMMIYGSFFIKMPMYLFHIWLPKAHVEAPVYGSMILAGILLKMGGYGLLRLLVMFINMNLKYNYFILSLGVVGSLVVSIMCLSQIDMKSLVAYSSVVHMNMMLCSLMTMFKLSFLSGYIMMISHGLCSSGLFYMVNLFYYRTGSRLLIFNKGMMVNLSSLMVWWFLLCVSNFSFPFSLNFISEVLMLMVLLNWDLMMIIYMILICFFSSAYSLYLYSYIQHGKKSFNNMMFNLSLIKEFIVLIMHFYPLFLFLLNLIMMM
nr:NADH dehydrogenase subunit 4 [Monomorium triviale]